MYCMSMTCVTHTTKREGVWECVNRVSLFWNSLDESYYSVLIYAAAKSCLGLRRSASQGKRRAGRDQNRAVAVKAHASPFRSELRRHALTLACEALKDLIGNRGDLRNFPCAAVAES